MIHALLVDDDAALRALVDDYLTRYGMQVTALANGTALKQALAAAARPPFDVLLLDLMLPDSNGLDLCRWVRQTSTLPIIMLTAQGDPASRVVGLELGADDYLPKPFEPRELVARINAVLRRAGTAGQRSPVPAGSGAPSRLRFKGWVFDRITRQLQSPQQVVVALSGAEFRLLDAFVEYPRRVLSRDRLLDLSRAPGTEVTDRAIDLAVSRLRQKLGDSPREPALIRTVRSEGYIFDADVDVLA
ncbi:MAG TPA: response regulator transcription factor [Burkholderiaceae bacterium]|nr:response regulator transcription factor [Burkholderiaceae bacterium]